MSTKVEISKRLVLINSASSVATQLINISVLVWLHQYLLGRISPEEYSILPVVMAVMVFVPLLTVILTSGLGRYIVEAYAKGDERRVTQIVSTMFPLLLGAGVLVLALGWTFAWHVGRILTIAPGRLWDARIMMTLLIFSAAIRIPLAPFGVGMYVRQKFVLSNCIRLCIQLLRIALLFVLLLGISTRVLWVVVASVSANLCSLPVTLTISCRLVPALRFRICEIRWKLVRELVTFGTWSFLGGLAYRIRQSADPIILNKLAGAIDVTCFHIGSLCQRQIETGLDTVLGPVGPPLTAMHAKGNKDQLRNAYLRIGRYALWLVLALAVPLMIYARELITLYVGEKYIDATTVLILLLALYPLRLGNLMLWKLAHAKAQMGPATWRAILNQSVNLGLTIYLVGWLNMGAIGAALSSMVVGAMSLVLLTCPLGLRMANVKFIRWVEETLCPGWLPSVAGGAVWVLLRILVYPQSWLSLGGCFACGLLCYVVVLFVFCLQPQDREDLRKVMAVACSCFPWDKRRTEKVNRPYNS